MSVTREDLPHTFGPWFARFPSLTGIQEKGIPAVLSGRDVLLSSPTASGKTEAYAAPAAELARRLSCPSGAVVVVSPTRALANDLKRRLEGPMGLVEVPFGRYTGEHKERVAGKLATVAVVTPEALDSLLARRPKSLTDVRMVVVDEVHVLDGTPRGDQLRILLHRLERNADARPQRVLASATVDRPDELAARYLDDPVIVPVPGARRILGRAFQGRTPAYLGSHLDDLADHGFKKVLVFCRSRNDVETYAAKLLRATRFGDAVYAHHGSLSRSSRERTERLFQQAPAAVCFATLTLELGIDIGTVDYVLLAHVPSDVSSLLQRIGRGGRREDATRCGFVTASAAEEHLFRTMFAAGKAGRLSTGGYGFRPSVLVQQALVMACARDYVELRDLEDALPPDVAAELGPGACELLLEAMAAHELLEPAGERFVPSEATETRYRRGSLHANIVDEAGLEVVDRLTGDIVGQVASFDTSEIEVGGRDRSVVKAADGRVLTDAGRGASPARFRPSGAPGVPFAFAREVVEGLGVEPGRIGRIASPAELYLLHGLGTAGVLLLLHLLEEEAPDLRVLETSPYTLRAVGRLEELPRPTFGSVSAFVDRHLARLSKLVGQGPWDKVVPNELAAPAVERMTGLGEIASFLLQARLQELEAPTTEVLAVLQDL